MEHKDVRSIHTAKLAAMKEKMVGSIITEKLELKAISNERINEVIARMERVVPTGKVWHDFSFRTGKLMGILRTIIIYGKQRKELLEITGLPEEYLDLYTECVGNVPWLNTKYNTIDPGRPMKFEEAKELMVLVGLHFDYVVEEADVADINPERWANLCRDALEKANQTLIDNEKNAGSIPEEGYEE